MEGIVPLAYNLKKAKAELLSGESMYRGMALAYTGGNIGPISNNITKVWNSSDKIGEEQLNVVKWLTYTNNQVIDYAKTLWLADPPKEVKNIIKSYTKAKVPDFFIYAKDKELHQVEQPNNSTMNRIAASIPDPKLIFSKSISKFDYRMLMNLDCDFSISGDSPVVKSYDEVNLRQKEFLTEDENIKGQNLYAFKKIREYIINKSNKDINYIVNTLVAFLYTARKTSSKKRLWDCFGDVILENLKHNLEGKGKICQICGKRFIPNKHHPDAMFCSEDCFTKYRRDYNKQKQQEAREKAKCVQ